MDVDPFARDDESYRTCEQCGGDCIPEPMPTDRGIRVAFICPDHGPHSFIDPFSDFER